MMSVEEDDLGVGKPSMVQASRQDKAIKNSAPAETPSFNALSRVPYGFVFFHAYRIPHRLSIAICVADVYGRDERRLLTTRYFLERSPLPQTEPAKRCSQANSLVLFSPEYRAFGAAMPYQFRKYCDFIYGL